ncbi:MAG: hypothetical protein IKM95_07670 [Bacteroidales bacterium]|nr:hypothetical protein [Bacteroidales bacterium]
MKKLLLVIVAVIGLSFAANAQNNAIGVRLGGGQGYGTELSFLQGLGASRIEADLGYYSYGGVGGFSLTGVYQRHFDIAPVPNLGWFAGLGAKANLVTGYGSTAISVGVVGQAGVDYRFEALPIQVSLDIRPCFYLYPDTFFHWGDVALGIRYTF